MILCGQCFLLISKEALHAYIDISITCKFLNYLIRNDTCFTHIHIQRQLQNQHNNSKNNTCQALIGGEDAHFVACQNWLGVADGIGQWSIEGI